MTKPLDASLPTAPGAASAPRRLFRFEGGNAGPWTVRHMQVCKGEALPLVDRLAVHSEPVPGGSVGAWTLRGITSNERYVERAERSALVERQEGLGRPASTHAALIPIRKTAAWWALTQDERRNVFEAQSRHIAIGMDYLPAIARRLHHCRDLGADEPFDFLTWFEYAPGDEKSFDALLRALRASPEWAYVDREIDIRLQLSPM